MENMTTRELSEVAGVSVDTIRRIAKKFYPGKLSQGATAMFNKQQSMDILQEVRKKNFVELNNQQDTQLQQSTEVLQQNTEVMIQAMAAAMQVAISPLIEEIKAIKSQPALPAPVKEDYYSLVAYFQLNKMTANRSELAMHGRELKKIARFKNLEIKKIPDERWGTVNSYPLEVLDEYFAV